MFGLAAALGLAVASCHRSRPQATPTADAGIPAPAESDTAAAPLPPRGKEIVVAYSSNILGEYEPCG